MRIIKIKFQCSICKNEYEHKVNPDSRGFFIVPKIHCAKNYVEMDWTIDGHGKQPDGEEEVKPKCKICKDIKRTPEPMPKEPHSCNYVNLKQAERTVDCPDCGGEEEINGNKKEG